MAISSDALFDRALVLVERSHAAPLIDQWRQENSTATPRSTSLPYTVQSVLVALVCVMLRRSEPTVATVFRTLLDMTATQLTAVGIEPAALDTIQADARSALPSFRDWLNRALVCLDSAPDQPAQRTSVREHAAIVSRRTPDQAAAYERAGERLTIIINRLIAGSIDPKYATCGAGDIVVDETIIDTSSAEQIFGGPDRLRGSVYCGGYYRRDRTNAVATSTARADATKLKKRGWGIGVTAISAVGPPDALHSRPILFTGVSMHPPTSGSLAGLREAVQHHRLNGFDSRGSGVRARWPMITFDMGYLRPGLFEWQVENRYAAVHTYPSSWNTDFWAVTADGERLGPIQLSGGWYCPSAATISLGQTYVARMRDILAADDWQSRDTRLRELLPRLMGVDRKPMMKRGTRGRPGKLADEGTLVPKMVLTCPAALGNIRCSRWVNPDTIDRLDLPLVEPPASMPMYRCCTQPTVTVTLTADQQRMQQLSPYAPGSYDHAIYCEAARSLTEQRFSLVKSRSVGGLSDFKYGSRREPLVKLTFAVAFAVVNIAEIERFEADGRHRTESIEVKWARLDRDLGKPAMRMPNRT
ncbi:hypothetical protein [Gordonia malaquae]|uniref:hypothetical protein n=1 Tax=Gordonia malaquae TaxID=410332 RepID=UPI0030FE0373